LTEEKEYDLATSAHRQENFDEIIGNEATNERLKAGYRLAR
jgi:hypothetical protein